MHKKLLIIAHQPSTNTQQMASAFIAGSRAAEAENVSKLYELKMKDEIERLKVIKEVTKDHHEGKLDPGKMIKAKRPKK